VSGKGIAKDRHASTFEGSWTEAQVKCNFEKLIWYLERRMGTDGELEVLEHLEKCEICFDTICELVRERAAFRAVHACRDVEIAGMKRAGTRKPDAGDVESFDLETTSPSTRSQGQIMSTRACGDGSRTCIRGGRRRVRWG
jgi:hypothetical protein